MYYLLVVVSRKKLDIGEIIDQTFAQSIASLLTDSKKELDDLLVAERNEISKFITSKKEELETFSNNLQYAASVNETQKHAKTLKAKNDAIKAENKLSRNDLNDNQQYVRRPNGVAINKDDDNSVIETVKSIIKETGIDLTDYCIDRAHRIGRRTK